MTEVSKELVPMTDGRAGFDAVSGRESRQYSDSVTERDVALINRHVRIVLLPGLHTEDWVPIRRVDRAVGRIGRIARTTLMVEAVGYKQSEEVADAKLLAADPSYARIVKRGATRAATQIRTAARVGNKPPHDMDAFVFGTVLALSQGMPVVSMDFDEVDAQRWEDMNRQYKTPRLQLVDRLVYSDFINMTIRDACQRVSVLRLMISRHERERQRERTAVGRLLAETLDQARQEEADARLGVRQKQPYTFLVLFGAGHLKGDREHLNRLGINYVVESLVDVERQAKADAYFLPPPLEQQERQCAAIVFAAQIFGLRAEQLIDQKVQDPLLGFVGELLDQLSDQEVREVYEEYRQFRLRVRSVCARLGPVGAIIERSAQGVYANKATRLLLHKAKSTKS